MSLDLGGDCRNMMNSKNRQYLEVKERLGILVKQEGKHSIDWQNLGKTGNQSLGHHLIRKTSNCRRRVLVDPRTRLQHQQEHLQQVNMVDWSSCVVDGG